VIKTPSWTPKVDGQMLIGYAPMSTRERKWLKRRLGLFNLLAAFAFVATLAQLTSFTLLARSIPVPPPTLLCLSGIGIWLFPTLATNPFQKSRMSRADLEAGLVAVFESGLRAAPRSALVLSIRGFKSQSINKEIKKQFAVDERISGLFPLEGRERTRSLTAEEGVSLKQRARETSARCWRYGLVALEAGIVLTWLIPDPALKPITAILTCIFVIAAIAVWIGARQLLVDVHAGRAIINESPEALVEYLPASKVILSKNGRPGPLNSGWRPAPELMLTSTGASLTEAPETVQTERA